MADAFSSSSETAIQRVVDVTATTNTPLEKLHETYQIKETCDFISERNFEKVNTVVVSYKTRLRCDNISVFISKQHQVDAWITMFTVLQVALQFPDELLVDSVAIAQEIEGNTKAKSYILGDTSYGR